MKQLHVVALYFAFLVILLIAVLVFRNEIDSYIPITAVKAQQECQSSHFLARRNDYYAKAIYLLNDIKNNAPECFK